jgi:hypothetical protein
MVGVLTKSLFKLHKENKVLKSQLASQYQLNETNISSTVANRSYETRDSNYQSKNTSSEGGDPYQVRRPKYYQHKPRNFSKGNSRREQVVSGSHRKIRLYESRGESEGTHLDRKADRGSSTKSRIYVLSSTKKNLKKLASQELEDDDELKLFLDAEREAQEAYLPQQVKGGQKKEKDCPEKKNLMNVLNNQLINQQSKSGVKRKCKE